MKGEKLAVDIAGVDFVVVNQFQRADARSGQSFDGVTADGSQTGDDDGGIFQPFKPVFADHQPDAGELIRTRHYGSPFSKRKAF